METKKYFAIISGKKTGVFYDTWSNVKDYVLGFAGAKYKSFKTAEEANKYMNKDDVQDTVDDDLNEEFKNMSEEKDAIAFTDGSYKEGINRYGSGAVIINKIGGRENYNYLSNYGTNSEYLSMRNVAGEILAVKAVIEWALERNYNSLHIYYDYQEIEQWADGLHKRNNELTRDLFNFVNEARSEINIEFSKVSAHTGVKYNEEADKLAKAALEED